MNITTEMPSLILINDHKWQPAFYEVAVVMDPTHDNIETVHANFAGNWEVADTVVVRRVLGSDDLTNLNGFDTQVLPVMKENGDAVVSFFVWNEDEDWMDVDLAEAVSVPFGFILPTGNILRSERSRIDTMCPACGGDATGEALVARVNTEVIRRGEPLTFISIACEACGWGH